MASTTRRWIGGVAAALAAGWIVCGHVPEALAFPYRATVGDTTIYAERPIPSAVTGMLARSDGLLRRSAIYGPAYGRRIFLTDGGWRWRMLAPGSRSAFAISRPLSETIVVNDSDVGLDVVTNGLAIAGKRSLSGVIAHERTHGLIRARYGVFADFRYPAWVREGYCDVVAGGGSLSDADVAGLKARHETVPALAYYNGRKRIEARLQGGRTVDALFAEAR